MLMMIPISIWTLSGCGNSDPVDWIDKNCGVLSDPRSQTAPLVSCGQKGPFRHEGGPLGGHCMVSRIPGFVGATQEWCRTFTQKHPNAIAYVFGKLESALQNQILPDEFCQIIFDESLSECPSCVDWLDTPAEAARTNLVRPGSVLYPGSVLGSEPTIIRDGNCGLGCK